MGSFAKMTVFPAGYFRAYSRWLLRERRDVAARVQVLGAEIERIGYVRVVYQTEPDGDGNLKGTHKRLGFTVTEGSSLARLVQAYIANGGNPWDISSFMYPDETTVKVDAQGNTTVQETYPAGGIVAPASVDYSATNVTHPGSTGYEADRGGYIENDPRYHPGRGLGSRIDPATFDVNSVVQFMHHIRAWSNQAIKEKLQDMEWRIVKLADLREQLVEERDTTLVKAFGGKLRGLPNPFDEEEYDRGMMVQNLIQAMNETIFEMDGNAVRAYRANVDTGFTYFVDVTDVSEVRDTQGV